MADDEKTEGEGEMEGLHDLGMGTLTLALTLGILARAWLSKYIKLPYTVIVLLLGLVVGLGVTADLAASEEDMFTRSIAHWINLSPEAILFTILPILIFESSFSSDLHLFMKQIVPVLILAVPAVLWNTLLIGLTARFVLPYHWDWTTSFMFGGMLSATDPIAVVAILKELGIAESLSVLIEGESLLNDGVAIVVFTIFSTPLMRNYKPTTAETLGNIASLCLGGPVIGIFVGAVSSYVLGFILNDPASEITVTVITCFGAYLLAESTGIHASGVLSDVCAGLYLSFYGLGRISARVTASLRSFWQMAGYITNTLIFFISGLIMAEKALVSSSVTARDWGYMVLLYLMVNLSRALATVIFYPSLSRGAYGIDWKQGIVLSWAGLRGAVSLTMALAVHQQSSIFPATRDRILFLTAGVVLLTIVINGTTAKPLINLLGLNKASWAEKEMFVRATSIIESRIETAAREFQRNKYLGDADWATVWRYIPVPSAQVYWHRIQKGNILLSQDELHVMGNHVEGGTDGPSSRRRGGRRFIKMEHLPPRLRSRWRRYLVVYNDLSGPHSEGLRNTRSDIHAAMQSKSLLREDGELHSKTPGGTGAGDKGPNLDRRKSDDDGGVSTPHSSHMVGGMVGGRLYLQASLFTPQLSRQNSFTRLSQKTPLDFEPFQANSISSLPEARLRLLTVLKHVYWGCFQNGLLSPHGLRAFEKNVSLLVADTSQPLDEWGTLEKNLLFPLRALQTARRWRRLPVVGALVESFLFARLAFLFEIAVVFIEAHTNIKMEDLFGSGVTSRTLTLEVNQEIRNAKATLKEFLPVFPDIFNSVKTEIATRFLLHRYRSLLESAFEEGSLNAREFEGCIKECDSSMVKLYDHAHAEAATPMMAVLSSVPFLRFVPSETLQSLFGPHSALCRDVFLRSGRHFLKEGMQQGLVGWYVIVRGSVVCGDDEAALPSGAVLGLCECLLDTPIPRTYSTTSLTHLLFFDKAAMLAEASRTPELLRSLWWYVAAHELRRMEGFQHLTFAQLGVVLTEERFIYVPLEPRQKPVSSNATIRLLQRRLGDRGNNTSSQPQGTGLGPSHPMMQGQLVDGAASSMEETMRKVEGDGNAHLLVLLGSVTPLAGPTTGNSAAGPASGEAVADKDGNGTKRSLGPASSPYMMPYLTGRYKLSPGTVCFYIPVTCLHPPTVVREPTELQAHAEVDETDDLDDIEVGAMRVVEEGTSDDGSDDQDDDDFDMLSGGQGGGRSRSDSRAEAAEAVRSSLSALFMPLNITGGSTTAGGRSPRKSPNASDRADYAPL